jgi:hypothetical protein
MCHMIVILAAGGDGYPGFELGVVSRLLKLVFVVSWWHCSHDGDGGGVASNNSVSASNHLSNMVNGAKERVDMYCCWACGWALCGVWLAVSMLVLSVAFSSYVPPPPFREHMGVETSTPTIHR